ncbi:MAG: hypothetical protein M9920_04180 [Verrucomicrobiae bacterium]|nr:hypothetical protein [Verrucomicrobiae bacterium]
MVKIVLGALVGGGLGFAAHRFVGCRSGACPLIGHPVLSTGIGAVLGALAVSG